MRSKIVTLCGSTKFKDAFIRANREQTLMGKIVLSVAIFGHQENSFKMDSEEKRKLDLLHLEKIKISDEVLILNVGGYCGCGTYDEIGYAMALNKKIIYLEEPVR